MSTSKYFDVPTCVSPVQLFVFRHSSWAGEFWVTQTDKAQASKSFRDFFRRTHETVFKLMHTYILPKETERLCAAILKGFVLHHFSEPSSDTTEQERQFDMLRPWTELVVSKKNIILAFDFQSACFIQMKTAVAEISHHFCVATSKEFAEVYKKWKAEDVESEFELQSFHDHIQVLSEVRHMPTPEFKNTDHVWQPKQSRHFVKCVVQVAPNFKPFYLFIVTKRLNATRISLDIRRELLALCTQFSQEKQTVLSMDEYCVCGCAGVSDIHKSTIKSNLQYLHDHLQVFVVDANDVRKQHFMRDLPLKPEISDSFVYGCVRDFGWVNVFYQLPRCLLFAQTQSELEYTIDNFRQEQVA